MKILPKNSGYLKNNETGQILIVFLLVLVVGMAIALSIASRTIVDIRQTTTSDQSNKAYFAAEAGVEAALKQLQSGYLATVNLDFSSTSNATTQATISTLDPLGGIYQIPDQLLQDDVAQVALITDFSNSSRDPSSVLAGDFSNTNGLNIYWQDSTVSAAIEVTVVGTNGTTWSVAKYAFDKDNSRGNNFCSSGVQVNNTLTSEIETVTYNFRAQIPNFSSNSSPNCTSATDSLTVKPVLARIRTLYNTTPIKVAVQGVGATLPTQGNVIVSTGKTDSGVTRQLKVYRSFPSLPPIFDYVLFNGSSTNSLKK
jgi:hypothetical protein